VLPDTNSGAANMRKLVFILNNTYLFKFWFLSTFSVISLYCEQLLFQMRNTYIIRVFFITTLSPSFMLLLLLHNPENISDELKWPSNIICNVSGDNRLVVSICSVLVTYC